MNVYRQPPFEERYPSSVTVPQRYLTKGTMERLEAFFKDKHHIPSREMWEALIELAQTMEEMANETAPPKLFLSSLDPGVGKTQTVCKFIQTLVSSPYPCHQRVGVLVCVGRLSEIKKLVGDMGLSKDKLAVFTSKPEINALSNTPMEKAQVLITTQQMLEQRMEGKRFHEAERFFFQGRPRQVRLWDETYLPGQTITLNVDELGFLFKPLRVVSNDLHQRLVSLYQKINDADDGSRLVMPDFKGDFGLELNDFLGLLERCDREDGNSLTETQRMVATILFSRSGQMVTIRKDGIFGNTVIDYEDTLPSDIAPMVILDASGRCRNTYEGLEKDRQILVRLKSASKRYDNLTIHLWQTGGGKRAWIENRSQLMEGIAKTIGEKPTEDWLVVIHKKDHEIGDIEKGIRDLLTVPQENVSFISWGQHMATNEFVEVKNIILAGTLFYRISYYEALKRLSSDRKAAKGDVTWREIKQIEMGENKHLILQALCRGAVRRCYNEFCHPMDAYIIASSGSGIGEGIADLFPCCKIKRWQPVVRTLRGKVKEAVSYLAEWMEASHEVSIKFSVVSKAIGVQSSDFTKDIRRHPDFVDAIAELGLMEYGPGIRKTSFIRSFHFYFGEG